MMLLLSACGDDDAEQAPDSGPEIPKDVLVYIKVPDDFLKLGARGFIFLSDSLGKTIVAREYHAGDSLILRAPDYTPATFTLTQGYINTIGQRFLKTFTDVPRGRWILLGEDNDRIPTLTETYLSYRNGDSNYNTRYELSSNYHSMSFYSGTLDGAQIAYYTGKDSKVFIGYSAGSDNDPLTHYLYFPSLVALKSTIIDLAPTKPMTTKEFDITAFDYVGYDLFAHSGNDEYEIDQVTEQHATLQFRYPGDAFSSYIVATYFDKGDDRYFRNTTPDAPDFTMNNSDINVTFENNIFSGSITGNADYATHGIHLSPDFDWIIFTHMGLQHVVLPEIPSILPGFANKNFDKASIRVGAFDARDYDGYDNFIQFLSKYPGDALVDNDQRFIGWETYRYLHIP